MPKQPGCCEDCYWWDNSMSSSQSDVETGACRGRAPRSDDRTGLAVWSFTEPGDWCGDFKPDEPL